MLVVIRLSDERVVVKRGIYEVLFRGSAIGDIAEALIPLLNKGHRHDTLVRAVPPHIRPVAQQFFDALEQRGLMTPGDDLSGTTNARQQAAFYNDFGSAGSQAPERLASAAVIVVGTGLVARTLVGGLLGLGIGKVVVADYEQFRNPAYPPEWLLDGGDRVSLATVEAALGGLGDSALLCAASDLGQLQGLFDLNLAALQSGVRFLPAWLEDFTGYVGPLVQPFETACLRCYRLRADSNHPWPDDLAAINAGLSCDQEAREGTVGLLPPMAAIVGEIATMEAAKAIGEFAPADVIGRQIEINLVSFRSEVRRVLKVPRCVDCGDVNKRGAVALTLGPLIPYD